ncbi:MAG: hypothetical protein QM710_09175 [Flavobacterium sp.]
MKKILDNVKYIDIAFALFVLVYFFYNFFKYTVNIPVSDDYGVIDNFTDIIEANSFKDKLTLFYHQHNEHRILYDKIWFYISYMMNDSGLNFNFLSFIGNLSLVGLVIFYYLKFRKEFSNYFLLFPLAALFLNLAFWENLTFSMASLCNFTFVLFAVISLHYLTKKETSNKDLFLSLLFFLFAMFTQGGGIFIFPVALLVLGYKKDKKQFIKYLVFAGVLMALYFVDFTKPESPKLADIISNAFLHLKFFLSFLGNAFANNNFFPDNSPEAILRSSIFGILIFMFYIFVFIRKYYKQNLFNFSVMTLIVGISFVTAINRLSQGETTSIASRYRLISILFLVCILIYILEFFKQKKYKWQFSNAILIAVSAAYLFLFNFNGTNEWQLSFRQRASMYGALNFFSGDVSLLNSGGPEHDAAIMVKAKNSEVFILNEKMIDDYYGFSKPNELNSIGNDGSVGDITKVENVKKLKDSYFIDGYAMLQQLDAKEQKVYVILSNNEKQTVFLAKNEFRPGLSVYFDVPNSDEGAFHARIKNEDISSGKNEISILIQNQGKSKIIKTDQILTKE